MMNLSLREKAIICGMFLSKFDSKGLAALGFETFKEAFNVLGLALNVKPASIKNYRDELDPLFPNIRQGWHKRKLREHCQKVYDTFRNYDLEEMASLVSNLTGCSLTTDESEESVSESETFAKRLLTGRAAENFFLANYRAEPEFTASYAIDVTQTGCGFDFRLQNDVTSSFSAVEVKGIRLEKGGISFTNKEHSVADSLGESYYLYIVKNFDEVPYAVKYCNPLRAGLEFKRLERKVIQISWSAKL
jgi:hypothetical protein